MSCKKILVNVEFNSLFRLENLLTFLKFYCLLLGRSFFFSWWYNKHTFSRREKREECQSGDDLTKISHNQVERGPLIYQGNKKASIQLLQIVSIQSPTFLFFFPRSCLSKQQAVCFDSKLLPAVRVRIFL